MNINEIIRSGANVQIVVNAAELKELFYEWQEEYCKAKESAYEEEYLTTDEVAKKVALQPLDLMAMG